MRTAIWVVMALVAGFVLGGLGPRADLGEARRQLAEARKAARAPAVAGPSNLRGVKDLLRLPDDATVRKRASERRLEAAARATASNAPASAATDESAGGPSPRSASAAPTNRAPSMAEGIRQASDLWNTRAAMARNGFVANVQLDAEQAAMFDTLVAAMNLRIEGGITRWVEQVKQQGQVNTENSVRAFNELSGALVTTYNELDRTLPEGWREKSGPEFDLVNFVDPAVAMPLVEVEDRFKDRRASGGGPNPLGFGRRHGGGHGAGSP